VAASAAADATTAGRRIASLRPNPMIAVEIEQVGGSRAFNIVEAPK
jgi:cobalt-zinc-cadmium efflux system outer membrane protein